MLLDKYLATPLTIIEELAFSGPPRAAKKVVADRTKKAANYISNWEASWEKMGWFDGGVVRHGVGLRSR